MSDWGWENLLPHMVKARSQVQADRILIEDIESGRRLTYSQFHAGASRWAAALAASGLSQGDTVATMFPVSITALEVWIGAAWLRALEVPLNNEYSGPMLAELLNRSKARILVISAEYADRLALIVDQLSILETVIVADGPAVRDLPFRTLTLEDCPGCENGEWPGPMPYDPLGIVFTSGTTGAAKGVVVPWAQLAGALESNFAKDDPADYKDGAVYCPWPPYNLLGKGALDIAVRQGLRLVLRRRFSQSQFWADIRRFGCTHATVPFIGPWLWREAETPGDADNPLRRVAMVPVMNDFAGFARRFDVRISTGYATTEAGYVFGTANPTLPASCGKLLDGHEVRVVDVHDLEVKPGEIGELIVRHKEPWHQMTAYFENPEATAAAWRNGWYHTGDAFRYDEDGNFFFSGRMKDYIKHRGQNISASDLELQVVEHDDVTECACVGMPTELAGEGGFADEDIKLFVVKSPASSLAEPDLYAFLKSRLPRFMYPQCIEFVTTLPRGELNKVLKRELRERPAGGIIFPQNAAAKS